MTQRVLLRSGKAPHQVVSAEASFAWSNKGIFAQNSGNFLFSHAAYRAINTRHTSIKSDALTTERARLSEAHARRINESFDVFVIPLANAFRISYVGFLERLTDVIEQLTIPVVVAGVGSQLGVGSHVNSTPPELDHAVTRFVSAVLDRSASIGVRGEVTRAYLLRLGFHDDQVDVIGCPSLNDYDSPPAPIVKAAGGIGRDSRLSINITPRVKGMGVVLKNHYERFPDLTYITQVYEELSLLMTGAKVPGRQAFLPADTTHPMFLNDQIRFFVDPAPWRSFLATRDFAFGNRIHGTIAALSAGIPAYLLVHDSRTLELADYHQIPHRLMKNVDAEKVRAEDLYDDADFTKFNENRARTLAGWTAFLDRNRIHHIHTPGYENPEYAATLASLKYPEGVGPYTALSPERLAHRNGWEARKKRALWRSTPDHFVPEFQPKRGLPGSRTAAKLLARFAR